MYSLLNKDYRSSIVIVKLSKNIMDLQVKNELGRNCSICHSIHDITAILVSLNGGDILSSHNKYCHRFYDGLMIQSTHNLDRGHHVQTLLLR